ncbi:DUF1090 domain-containing protein [Cupriavidus agavae]|uniref:Uncharacterized protein DUF1090 n=1 Tax=Cupriavidus agavae TaxID=1001822 RepID=A0A4Q7S161_9BURK|nr:DUF1090 domain-containing protein [Cupriavidus agavae]RZT39337.1 uncharacterized protein DUF1090 [Cupriavidus agavae]
MKQPLGFTLALLCATAVAPVWAQGERCDAKRVSLEKEIAYAKAHGNAQRVAGLETALANVKANCTDASLDARQQKRIRAAQDKVEERQRDLDKAKADGKSQSKIDQRQRKLDDAHQELERAQIGAATANQGKP